MATPEGKVPIWETVKAGLTFARSSLPVLFPAAALVSLLVAAGRVLSDPHVAANPSMGGLVLAIGFLATIAYSAFLYRLAINQDASGFFGLKLGKDELNLLSVTMLLAAVLVIIALVFLFVLGMGVASIAASAGIDLASIRENEEQARILAEAMIRNPVMIAAMAGFAALIIWLSTRLVLAAPATIGEGRIMAFSTWNWTKHNFWRTVAALFLLGLIIGVPMAIVISLITALVQAATNVPANAISSNLGALAAVQFFSTLIQSIALTPAAVGSAAFLYRGLRPAGTSPAHG